MCRRESESPRVPAAAALSQLEHATTAMVLHRDFYECPRVRRETLQELEERNVSVHVQQTEEVPRLYNELHESERTGALVHLTCLTYARMVSCAQKFYCCPKVVDKIKYQALRSSISR